MDEAGDDVDEVRDDSVVFCYGEVWTVVWWCGG